MRLSVKKGTFRNGEICSGALKTPQKSAYAHTHWMAGVSACVCVLSVTPPRCGDPTHCEPCVRSLYLLPVFQAYIQPKRPKCKQHTNNTEAHEPIVTGYTSTWTPPTLNWKLLILKTKLYFQSNGMSEQDSLGDKFACKRLRQKYGHQWINWKPWLMAVSSSLTANYIKEVLLNLFLWNELLNWSPLELRMLLHTVLGSCKPESISVINSSFKLDSRLMMSSMTSSICAYQKEREKTV